jgi:hypothetical protein
MAQRADSAAELIERELIAPEAFDTLRRDGSIGASFALWALGTLAVWCETNL